MYEKQTKTSDDEIYRSQSDRRRLTALHTMDGRWTFMYIPMIFFTIIIEKRKLTPEQRETRYLQQKAIAEWEERKHQIAMQFPEFLYR